MQGKTFYGFYVSNPIWVEEKILGHQMWTDLGVKNISKPILTHATDNYTLLVCYDGLIALRIESIENKINSEKDRDSLEKYDELGKYLNYLNCLNLLFESALIQIQNEYFVYCYQLTTRDIILMNFDGDNLEVVAVPSYTSSEVFSNLRNDNSLSKSETLPQGDNDRLFVEQAVFDLLFTNIDHVFNNYGQVLVFSQIMKSLSEYRIANNETSLILSWFVIEALLQKRWETWLLSKNTAGSKRINKERFDNLKGRDYPISVITNFLELSNELSHELYTDINKIRKIRNSIVHQTQVRTCSYKDCRLALEIAAMLIKQEEGLASIINLDLSFPHYWF